MRSLDRPIRWGILGAANIARTAFLPALREATGGRAVLVASRDRARGEAYAAAHGVEATSTDYRAAIDPDRVDAVYVALPNHLHGEWTRAALEAGVAVLCEKPLCAGAPETERVLAVAGAHPSTPLWEAFVFPFQAQHARLLELIAGGAIGTPAELDSVFHFRLDRDGDFRLSAAMGGGALADVGCYPVRLGHELFGPADGPVSALGRREGGVDVDVSGLVAHGERRLSLSCSFSRAQDTFARVSGTAGSIQLTNPFHPTPADTLTILTPDGDAVVETPTTDEWSFTAALRHIHRVLSTGETPQHLAVDSAASTAVTLDRLRSLVP